jgi:hypothetical protein
MATNYLARLCPFFNGISRGSARQISHFFAKFIAEGSINERKNGKFARDPSGDAAKKWTMSSLRLLFLLLMVLFLFASCFSRPALMTYSDYDKVEIGMPITKLQSEIGKPYAIHAKEGGTEEYEYIERIDSGNNLIAENHYFLIVEDGKVVGKYMSREQPPAYDLIYQEEPNYPSYP